MSECEEHVNISRMFTGSILAINGKSLTSKHH
ncbi:hypothetical protein F7U80_22950 [Vibrio parahaemolyticus]|nr:hypothetical protein [Vibrio parahaemolyticus]